MSRLYLRNTGVTLSGPLSEIELTWKQSGKWFGILWDHVGVLNVAGVIDLGDPNDPIYMATPLPSQQTRAVEQFLGLPNNSLDGAHPCAVLFALRDAGFPLQFLHPGGGRHFHAANPDVMGAPLAVFRGWV